MSPDIEVGGELGALWKDLHGAETVLASLEPGSRDHRLMAELVARLKAGLVERRKAVNADLRVAFAQRAEAQLADRREAELGRRKV